MVDEVLQRQPQERPLAARLWEEAGRMTIHEALARNASVGASLPIGGRLQHFAKSWKELEFQTDWCDSLLRQGLQWEWLEGPPSEVITGHQRVLSEEDSAALEEEIETFRQAGAVKEVPREFARAILPMFTVPKKDGGKRGIINAAPVNSYIHCPSFRIEDLRTVAHLVGKGDWMLSLDLTKAYIHVPLPARTSRYLCFEWKGKIWTFTCLPFGVNVAPRVFTKLMRIPIAEIRYRGVRISIYLDDIILIGSSKAEVLHHAVFTILLLTTLGFVLNAKKCLTAPSTRIEHLGLTIDSVRMSFGIPPQKRKATLEFMETFLNPPEGGEGLFSARQFSKLAGRLGCLRAAAPYVLLYTRHLSRLISAARKLGGWSRRVLPLSPEVRSDLEWLTVHLPLRNSAPFSTPHPVAVMQTDASFFAWSGILRTRSGKYEETRGLFPSPPPAESISPLELEAGIRTITTFQEALRGTQLLWRSDNASVVWGVTNWKSSSPEMNAGLRRLYELCHDMNLRIVTQHVPGVENYRPDFLSRWVDPEDWKCNPLVFSAVCSILGPCQVDAFASSENHLLPRWWSRFPATDCEAVDALRQDFTSARCWCNPPFSLLLPLLRRIMSQRASAVVILPVWPAQAWWPLLMELLVHPPLLLPDASDLFLPQSTLNQEGKGRPPWPIWAVEVSGHPARRTSAKTRFGSLLSIPSDEVLRLMSQQRTQTTSS